MARGEMIGQSSQRQWRLPQGHRREPDAGEGM